MTLRHSTAKDSFVPFTHLARQDVVDGGRELVDVDAVRLVDDIFEREEERRGLSHVGGDGGMVGV